MEDKDVSKDNNASNANTPTTADGDVIYVNYDAREERVDIEKDDANSCDKGRDRGSDSAAEKAECSGSSGEVSGASKNVGSNASKNIANDASNNTDTVLDTPKNESMTSEDNGIPDSKASKNTYKIQQETVEKWKKRLSFFTPLFAGLVVNVISGIFFISFLLVVSKIVRDAFDEDAEMVSTVQNTFRVFAAIAAAACAPLMIKYGFRKVALGGSVLLIFSCLSSSLTSTADILAIPYGFMGGIALGLLRTTGIVSTLDFLHKRPVLALILSTMCFIIGQIIGIFVFLFEMNQYVGSRRRWPNVMRIFEVTAVIGLLAGCFLPKTSNTQQNVPQVFKHPPFYFILSIRTVVSIGLSIVVPSTLTLPGEREFPAYLYTPILSTILIMLLSQFLATIILLVLRKCLRNQLKRTALVTFGSLVLVIGVVTMLHQVAFVHPWPVAVFGLFLGVVQALDQSMVPLALVNTTGRKNYKLALPLLSSVSEVGGLIGGGTMERISEATSSVNGSLYYAAVTMILGGIGAIVTWVSIKRWPPLEDETLARPFKRGADNSYTPTEEQPETEE